MEHILKNAMSNPKFGQNSLENQIEVGKANIKVIGVGGAGSNMVNWLYQKGIKGAEIIACNTDMQHLNMIESDKKFLIGRNITRGLGCGGFPAKGNQAAQESVIEIKESLKGADMIYLYVQEWVAEQELAQHHLLQILHMRRVLS